MTQPCFWCGAPSVRTGVGGDPLCQSCCYRMYDIWYVHMNQHDDFGQEDGMYKGHMYYQKHHCSVGMSGRDRFGNLCAWCFCGRELRTRMSKDPLAFVAEQVEEIMQRCGGVL